jgi:hypothetical protein
MLDHGTLSPVGINFYLNLGKSPLHVHLLITYLLGYTNRQDVEILLVVFNGFHLGFTGQRVSLEAKI